jgi:uncharacterized protein (TIGR02266 family)
VTSALGLRVKFKGTTLQEFAQRYKPDLSPTGMFVRTDKPLAVGSRVRFTFSLENDEPLLSGEAVVVWVAEENKELSIPSGMELRFDSLAPDSQDRFHWLQMEKRGVTVGRERPVSVSTSYPSTASSDGAASARASGAVVTPPAAAAEPPASSSPPGEDEVVEVRADELPRKRQTLPLGVKPDEEPRARATQPFIPSAAPLALRSPAPVEELGPGDSDPSKLFHAVASRSDPEISFRKEQERVKRATRPFLWGIGVGVLLLLGWVGYLSTRTKPPPPRDATAVPRELAGPARALRVVSDPTGAEVLLNGQLVGVTPLVIRLQGTERVLIRRPGYIAEGLVLATDAPTWKLEGQRLVMALDLKLQRAPHPSTVVSDAAPVVARPHLVRRPARDPEAPGPSVPKPEPPPVAGTQATPPKTAPPPDPSAPPDPPAAPSSAPAVKPTAPTKTPTWVKDPSTAPPAKIRKPSWSD